MNSASATDHPAQPATQPKPEAAPPGAKPVRQPRLDAIDVLRGVIMVFMALDHVRDLFTNVLHDPLDLTQTSPILFLTRWITHYAAPNFVFLAGTGAFLGSTRGKSKSDLSYFLWTRGVWLIFLELTVVRFSWAFNLDFRLIGVQVFWALGWSMLALSALVHLPTRTVGIFGVLMVLLHNSLDGKKPEVFGPLGWLWQILHAGGVFTYGDGRKFLAGYPLIPWIGVMAAGYAFGTVLLWERERRRPFLIKLGLGMILAFIVLRAVDVYGDARHWSQQKNLLFTLFSFVHTTKYPPSLLYCLMTIGPGITFMGLADRPLGAFWQPFITFGRVPMFYYLLHMPLIHTLAVIFAWPNTKDAMGSFYYFSEPKAGYGYNLAVVYAVWILVVLILYPACRWFAGIKQRRRDAWLGYF